MIGVRLAAASAIDTTCTDAATGPSSKVDHYVGPAHVDREIMLRNAGGGGQVLVDAGDAAGCDGVFAGGGGWC